MMRGIFAFSKKEAERLLAEENFFMFDTNFNPQKREFLNEVKLDTGLICEYTQCYLNENPEESEEWKQRYLSVWEDGEILGVGTIYSINGIIQK